MQEVTELRPYSRIEREIISNKRYTDYSDGKNIREDSDESGTIRILNYDEGYQCVFTAIVGRNGERSTYAVKHPILSKPYTGSYFAGRKLACRIGPCRVDGIYGVEWSYPDQDDASKTEACISPDGPLLQYSLDGEVRHELISIDRKTLAKIIFAPPDNVKIVDQRAFDLIISTNR